MYQSVLNTRVMVPFRMHNEGAVSELLNVRHTRWHILCSRIWGAYGSANGIGSDGGYDCVFGVFWGIWGFSN